MNEFKSKEEKHMGDLVYFVNVANGMLSALQFIHENGLVHRDVKVSKSTCF